MEKNASEGHFNLSNILFTYWHTHTLKVALGNWTLLSFKNGCSSTKWRLFIRDAMSEISQSFCHTF